MLILLSCMLSGVFGGVLGIGGGIIIIPLLKVVGGLPWETAYALSLFSILSSSLLVSYPKLKRHLVDFTWAPYFEAYGCLGALVGAQLAFYFAGAYITEALLVLAVIVAIYFICSSWSQWLKGGRLVNETGAISEITSLNAIVAHTQHTPVFYKVFVSWIAGLASGFLGIGGGTVIIGLSPVIKRPMHVITATSGYALGGIAMGALLGVVIRGDMPWAEAMLAYVGTFMGAHFGVQLSLRTSEDMLKAICSVAFVVLTGMMIYHYFI
ncbi:MAG: sulfite exporter TauE/SafE family protein [Proteobacteria bacterium]|nr:sulfite exporter TauE/SafE family protein [Pseudomonadota bacterium]